MAQSDLLKVATALGRFGAWSVDIETGRVTWSEEVHEMRKVPQSVQSTIDDALEHYAPEDRSRIRETFEACGRDGTPFDIEVQSLMADLGRRWVRVIGIPVRDDSGRIVRVQGAFQDIHASKTASERQREHAERFRRTLDRLTDGFATFDRDYCITYANAAALNMFGLAPEQVLGVSLFEIFPGVRGSVFEDNYRRVLEENVAVQFEAEYPPLEMWFRLSAFPSEDGFALSFADVTETKRAHKDLMELNAQLEQRVRRRTEELERMVKELEGLAYTVAHDLRQPLSAIRGFAQALEESEEQQLGERSLHYVRRIRNAAAQMDEMTDAILSLCRLSRRPMNPELVDIAVIARECIANVLAQDPARKFGWNVMPCLWSECDPALVRIVLQNLIGNAWKYTAESEDALVEIGTELREGNAAIHYFVRDNGIGFDPGEAERIFEPFYRAHSAASRYEGTGIGLATVRAIVERHGGRIWAESLPGSGARFVFTLSRDER